MDPKIGEVLTLERASPEDAARATVAGIIAGDDEILRHSQALVDRPADVSNERGVVATRATDGAIEANRNRVAPAPKGKPAAAAFRVRVGTCL